MRAVGWEEDTLSQEEDDASDSIRNSTSTRDGLREDAALRTNEMQGTTAPAKLHENPFFNPTRSRPAHSIASTVVAREAMSPSRDHLTGPGTAHSIASPTFTRRAKSPSPSHSAGSPSSRLAPSTPSIGLRASISKLVGGSDRRLSLQSQDSNSFLGEKGSQDDINMQVRNKALQTAELKSVRFTRIQTS